MAAFKTKLGKARPEGDFLRTSVPMGIVRQLQLKEGDELTWKLEIRDNDFIIVVKPVKKE